MCEVRKVKSVAVMTVIAEYVDAAAKVRWWESWWMKNRGFG